MTTPPYLITLKTLPGDIYTFYTGNGKDISYDPKNDTIDHLKSLLSSQLDVDQKLIKLMIDEENEDEKNGNELKNKFMIDHNGWKTMVSTPLPEKNISLFLFVESSEYHIKVMYYQDGENYENIRRSIWKHNSFEKHFDLIFCPSSSEMFVLLDLTLTREEGNDFKLLFLKQTQGDDIFDEDEEDFRYEVRFGYTHTPSDDTVNKPVWEFCRIVSRFDEILRPVLERNHVPDDIINQFEKTLIERKRNLIKMMIQKPMNLDQIKVLIKDEFNAFYAFNTLMNSVYDTKEKEKRALQIFDYLLSLGTVPTLSQLIDRIRTMNNLNLLSALLKSIKQELLYEYDEKGNLPIHYAFDIDTIDLLVSHTNKEYINRPNKNGKTLLKLIKDVQNEDNDDENDKLIKELIQRGAI